MLGWFRTMRPREDTFFSVAKRIDRMMLVHL
jgi:hypothetical protein